MSEVNPTIKVEKPAYELTVHDFVLCFREGDAYSNDLLQLPIIKTLNVEPDASSKKIYASGGVYDIATAVRGAKLGLGAVALPHDMLVQAAGSVESGATAYDKSLPLLPEFGCGYWGDMSDGSQVYYWHPRCKLTIGTSEHKTSDDSDIDPEVSQDIEAMPTDGEGIWKMRYFTSKVPTGQTPLTPEAFYKLRPYTAAQLAAAGSQSAT